MKRKSRIQRRIISFTVVLFLLLTVGFSSVIMVSLNIASQLTELFEQSNRYTQLSQELEKLEELLDEYLNSKDSDSLVTLMNVQANLERSINDEGYSSLKQRQIQAVVISIIEQSNQAINYKRARYTEGYILAFDEVSEKINFVDELIDEANKTIFQNNLIQYQNLSSVIESVRGYFYWIVGLILFISLIFIVDFNKTITSPINALIYYAKQVSKGKYPKEIVLEDSYEEADVLRDTFVNMSTSIDSYISELKEQNEMERKLTEYELDHLKLENRLKEAELQALQAQINPHFLFNTLNAGLQLAHIEGAEETAEFIENLSQMLRYNMQSNAEEVTLENEFDNLKHYFNIMGVRFQDLLEYDVYLEEGLESFLVPPLILQPIVENAMIHGFKDKLDVGKISVFAMRDKNDLLITITDNGWGMRQSKISFLKNKHFHKTEETRGHTTGIGISNVMDKMKIKFGDRFDLIIESEISKGTTFKLIVKGVLV